MLNNFILQSVDKRDILSKSLPEPKGDKWENPHGFALSIFQLPVLITLLLLNAFHVSREGRWMPGTGENS